MIDLDNYRLFAAIADHGGLAPAARALGLSKSMISHRLTQLEQQFRTPLAERTTRKFRLTREGMQFLEGCRAILATAAETEQRLALSASRIGGQLRLSSPPGLVDQVLTTIIPTFMEAYPDVQINLAVTNRRMDLVREDIDVAFRVRVSLDDDQSFMQRTIARNQLLLAASPDFLAAHPSLRKPADLARLPTLGRVIDPFMEVWRFQRDGEIKYVRHNPRLRCEDFNIQLSAAIAGLGVALMPGHLCKQEIADGRLNVVMPDWKPSEALVHMVYNKELSVTVSAFIDHVVRLTPSLRGFFNAD